jgi:hypothetical protein
MTIRAATTHKNKFNVYGEMSLRRKHYGNMAEMGLGMPSPTRHQQRASSNRLSRQRMTAQKPFPGFRIGSLAS